jgi:hypothetical protein
VNALSVTVVGLNRLCRQSNLDLICLNLILLNSLLNETPLFYSGTRVWIYDICGGEDDISYDFDPELKSRFLEIRKIIWKWTL